MHLVLYIFIKDYIKSILITEVGKAKTIILLYLNI
jgi:hypothetical protein